jgi:hypothetical protein
MAGVLIHNGGPIPPEKWAEAQAKHIAFIPSGTTGKKLDLSLKLQAAIAAVLEKHHHTVQQGERIHIKTHGHDRLTHQLDADCHCSVDAVADEVIACAKGTPWEADFNYQGQPEIAGDAAAGIEPQHFIPSYKSLLVTMLARNFRTNMHIERSWHADRNPDEPQCKAFHAAHNCGHHHAKKGGA